MFRHCCQCECLAAVCSDIVASVSVWQRCVAFGVNMCSHMTGGKFYITFWSVFYMRGYKLICSFDIRPRKREGRARYLLFMHALFINVIKERGKGVYVSMCLIM